MKVVPIYKIITKPENYCLVNALNEVKRSL